MSANLKKYLTMQIWLKKLTLEEVKAKYPDFEMED